MISIQKHGLQLGNMYYHTIKDYLAAVYDKHTTTFQTVITKIQTFSIYGIYIYVVVVHSKLLVVYV